MGTSTRNDYSGFDRSLRRLNRALSVFSEAKIKEDILALEPKDRLDFYLKTSKFVLENKEYLKTPGMKEKEGTLNIEFIDNEEEEDE